MPSLQLMVAASCLLLLQGGCNQICTGASPTPACEDVGWPGTALGIHLGKRLPATILARGNADYQLTGTAEDGARWSIDSVDGTLVLGRPRVEDVTLAPWSAASAPAPAFRGSFSFGSAVAADDLEADGSWDLWVGAPERDLARGEVTLFRDAESWPPLDPDVRNHSDASVTIRGLTPGDQLGSTITICPDMTGDGIVDTLISAPHFSGSSATDAAGEQVPELAGAVALIPSERLASLEGSVELFEVATVWTGPETSGFGHTVSCDADLDADGLADLFIGAPWAGDDANGGVYYLSSTALEDSSPELILTGDGDWLGYALATGRVTDTPSLFVGAPGHAAGQGRVLVYPLLDWEAPAHIIRSDGTGHLDTPPAGPEHLGHTIAVADLDGTGQDELLLGQPAIRDPRLGTGRLTILRADSEAPWAPELILAEAAQSTFTGTRAFMRIGGNIHLDDLDGDGVTDLVLATRLRASLIP